ncbi:MAG: bifunctional UDP-N-acetylglucosamine diphosphorylase/glucosamine-1-phosphate N-acetyltransferase GlmU [Candidatus Rokuibacteriota bacterium]|nr:MAG: bifunctional UDP-N-acetylglucosamine diphosphorylase/glucosamine-1-phosphate N-acetyltransferase GlmU [Candidatus Rokubacteria bacterium]
MRISKEEPGEGTPWRRDLRSGTGLAGYDADMSTASPNDVTVVILAAGEGKRMRSRQPKVLHPLCGRPLIAYALRAARMVADRLVLVVGSDGDGVTAVAGPGVAVVEQRERLGTGHAVQQARAHAASGTVLVVAGDMPLLTGETLERLVVHHCATRAAATILSAVASDPHGYGRVLRQGGRVARIVEERDATDDQKKISEINTSVYCFDAARLWPALDRVESNNDQGEYYLTDAIGILSRSGARVEAVVVGDPDEALGVNDRKQLAAAAAIQRRRILDRLMLEGVTILDPATTYIGDEVLIGADTVIHPHVTIEGDSVLGNECVVATGCHISKSRLADRVTLRPYCVLAESVVEENAILGPFCHLRPNSHVGPEVHIGNFVELKKTRMGRGAKANHLAYLGDATVGERVNVGAGAITCNYDGFRKHDTTIGDDAFVGTNVNMVAPITIGEGSYIGAGSTVTKDVPADALVVERAQPIAKDGWAARWRARHGKPRPGETKKDS